MPRMEGSASLTPGGLDNWIEKEQRAAKFTLDKESPIQGMEGFEPLALVVGASGGLAVDGDDVVPLWPHGGDEGLEAAREQRRIDPVHQIAQPAGARHAVMEVTEAAQEIEVVLAPKDDLVEVVAGGDRGAGHQEQNLLERVGDAPALALVVQLGKVLEQDRQSVRGESHLHRLVHWGLLESGPPDGITSRASIQISR